MLITVHVDYFDHHDFSNCDCSDKTPHGRGTDGLVAPTARFSSPLGKASESLAMLLLALPYLF
jgi:hypothetical protein